MKIVSGGGTEIKGTLLRNEIAIGSSDCRHRTTMIVNRTADPGSRGSDSSAAVVSCCSCVRLVEDDRVFLLGL